LKLQKQLQPQSQSLNAIDFNDLMISILFFFVRGKIEIVCEIEIEFEKHRI